MTKILTLREANQTFSRCIQQVQQGEDFVVTRNGTPVAKIVPVNGADGLTGLQRAALKELQAYWATLDGPEVETFDVGPLDREGLYER